MFNQKSNNSFHIVFVMLLFLTIVIMSVMIILLGQNIYESINDDRAENYEKRVSLSYIANKIRQADKENSIQLKELDGSLALVIKEVYENENYETWIYYYNNGIYELFTDENNELKLEDGMKIMSVKGFTIEKLNNQLYKFTAKNNIGDTELILNINSNQQ